MESETFFFNITGDDGIFAIPKCRWYSMVSLGGPITVLTRAMAIDGSGSEAADPSDGATMTSYGKVWPENLPCGPQQSHQHGIPIDGVWVKVPTGSNLVGMYCKNTSKVQ